MNSTSGSAVEDRKKGVLTIAQLIKEAEDKKRQVSIPELVLSNFLVLGLMLMIINYYCIFLALS